MICNKCGKEIPDSSKFCPECGNNFNQESPAFAQQPSYQQPVQQAPYFAPPPAPPRKKGLNKGLIAVGIIAIFIVGMVVLFGGRDDATTDGTTAEGNITSTTEAITEPKSTFAVNEPATYKDTEITLTKVTKSPGSEWEKPKEGMEYVIVTVRIKNVGQEYNISYNPYDFKMQNSQGQIVDNAFTIINSDTSLSSGELAPGGQIEGTIVFEQPKGDAGLSLQYNGSLWSSTSKLTFTLQ